jgi:hypothetical protein
MTRTVRRRRPAQRPLPAGRSGHAPRVLAQRTDAGEDAFAVVIGDVRRDSGSGSRMRDDIARKAAGRGVHAGHAERFEVLFGQGTEVDPAGGARRQVRVLGP